MSFLRSLPPALPWESRVLRYVLMLNKHNTMIPAQPAWPQQVGNRRRWVGQARQGVVAPALGSRCSRDGVASMGAGSCSLSFHSIVCYKTLSSGTVTPGTEETSRGAGMMARPSWIWMDKAPATGEFVERTLFESELARLEGFEPTTLGSEDRCSNPLSYRRWGGRRDSNPRSPGPQPGALSLWATPTTVRPF